MKSFEEKLEDQVNTIKNYSNLSELKMIMRKINEDIEKEISKLYDNRIISLKHDLAEEKYEKDMLVKDCKSLQQASAALSLAYTDIKERYKNLILWYEDLDKS